MRVQVNKPMHRYPRTNIYHLDNFIINLKEKEVNQAVNMNVNGLTLLEIALNKGGGVKTADQ